MTQKDPKHNLNALLVGMGEFSFCDGATSVADTLLKGFLDFGNIVAFTPKLESTTQEHFGSYRGVRRADKTITTQSRIQYELKCDEWNMQNLRVLFGASDGTAFTQSAQSAASGDALVFTAPSPSGTQKWYNVLKSGARIRNLTALTITSLVEGTDFEVDALLGRIRFLVNQTASVTPTITAPAITAGTAASFLALLPLQGIIKTGYGRLTIYDQFAANKVVLDHVDFSCEVTASSASEINGTGITDLTLLVNVTSEVGTVYLRNDNNN